MRIAQEVTKRLRRRRQLCQIEEEVFGLMGYGSSSIGSNNHHHSEIVWDEETKSQEWFVREGDERP